MNTIIDNFFDEDELKKVHSLSEKIPYRSTPTKDEGWKGERTNSLHLIDEDFFHLVANKIIKGVWGDHFIYNYIMTMYFHKLLSDHKANDTWLHEDDVLYAGVIYLNEQPPKNTGTLLKNLPPIENKYNRMIIYPGNITHRVENTFDTRTTLTFFISKICFSIGSSI